MASQKILLSVVTDVEVELNHSPTSYNDHLIIIRPVTREGFAIPSKFASKEHCRREHLFCDLVSRFGYDSGRVPRSHHTLSFSFANGKTLLALAQL